MLVHTASETPNPAPVELLPRCPCGRPLRTDADRERGGHGACVSGRERYGLVGKGERMGLRGQDRGVLAMLNRIWRGAPR